MEFKGVEFSYQVVEPGKYIHLQDAEYQTKWTKIPMRNDGKEGDEFAGDSIFTCQVPSDVQKHRTLVRYRITATDKKGLSVTVPYTDDPQPNFAYFCL